MNKSNVTTLDLGSFGISLFECPLCKKIVSADNFITSHQVIEGTVPPVYRIKNLCCSCRDSGE